MTQTVILGQTMTLLDAYFTEGAVMEPTYQERLEAIPWTVCDELPELIYVGEIIQAYMDSLYPYEAILMTTAIDEILPRVL